jgi:hypothetical protein
MKNKIQQLIRVGLSKELLKNLSEGQVNQLHRRMISEQVKATTMVSSKNPNASQIAKDLNDKGINVTMTEMGEDADLDDSAEKGSGFNPYAGNSVGNDDGPSSDDGFGSGDDGMGMMETEIGEGKKKKSKDNPYAICTTSVGREDMKKFKRCVKDVERNIREGKNPHQVVVEMALEKMIEKHISPRMTKGDLINTLSEQGIIRRPMSNMRIGFVDEGMDKPTKKSYSSKKESMEQQTKEAPTRVKPGTKEKEKPGKMDPFKNPKHQPKPKASTKSQKMGTVEIPDFLTFDQLKINFKDQ